MKWWKGIEVKVKKEKVKVLTLLDALNNVVTVPKRPSKEPFRMPVSGVHKIKGVGDVITGRIEQGKLKPGIEISFSPTNTDGKCFSIEMHHKNINLAKPGDNVGVNVKALKKENMPKVGDIMFIKDEEGDSSPPKAVSEFTAIVFVQEHPGQLKAAIKDPKSRDSF